jgi:hypothetical protein
LVRKCWGGDRREGRDDEAEPAQHPDCVCPRSVGEGEERNSGDEAGAERREGDRAAHRYRYDPVNSLMTIGIPLNR